MSRISGPLLRRATAAAALALTSTAAAVALATPAMAATGTVHLTHNQTHLVLAADSANQGARVRLVAVAHSGPTLNLQQWAVRTNSGTAALTYVLKQKITANNGTLVEGCLDLVGDVAQAGQPIVVRPCDGTNSQRWLDVNTSGSNVELENKVGFMKLNVTNPAVGTPAVQGTHSGADQKFFRAVL